RCGHDSVRIGYADLWVHVAPSLLLWRNSIQAESWRAAPGGSPAARTNPGHRRAIRSHRGGHTTVVELLGTANCRDARRLFRGAPKAAKDRTGDANSFRTKHLLTSGGGVPNTICPD